MQKFLATVNIVGRYWIDGYNGVGGGSSRVRKDKDTGWNNEHTFAQEEIQKNDKCLLGAALTI